MNYVPLHVHTHYSGMDGVATPEEYVARATNLGMTSLAITDHGTLSGHRPLYRAAKAAGIKPILGMEAYFAADRHDQRSKKERVEPLDRIYHHLIVIAKNNQGLENLMKMNEIAWNGGFYTKPRIDFELLDKYGEGIVVGSACMGGLINQAIENEDFAAAKRHLKWFGDRFGDDFYVELMPHNTFGMNAALTELADAGGYKTIVTPDCHHATDDQKVIQEMMLILNTHAKLEKGTTYAGAAKIPDAMERLDYLYGHNRKLTFNKFDIHLLSYEEMYRAMEGDMISALEYTTEGKRLREDMFTNTLEVADKIEDYDIPRNLNLLPAEYRDPDKELRRLTMKGLKDKDLEDEEHLERAEEELGAIASKNFAPYFIVVHNMIVWARKQGIRVGPGRGSSAGSLVCYATDITEIDPIPDGLLFFRFIDIERDDFPDIDTDFQDNRREEVKDYLERQYKHVASIATFTEFSGKGIVRDVSRVLNVPLGDVNAVLKKVDNWDDYVYSKSAAWFREKYPDVERYGAQLRGRIRSTGIHPAGVVSSKIPISKVAPMETRDIAGKDGRIPVVALNMDEVADIGLIKKDLLGLKTLTVIDDTIKLIKERTGKDVILPRRNNELGLEDYRIYQMLSEGRTKGVFQCEAAPYTALLVKMGISKFDELVATNALVRPGAMDTIGKDYIARKQGRQATVYANDIMKEFTGDTYGCILYQEQVMLACTKLGGMSMGEANKVRKIIGKKRDATEFDQFKSLFIGNASGPLGPAAAEKMWHDFEAHAGYSFNKSHAVAYSTVSYWSAWLKYYYPLEFMLCLLNNENEKDGRTEYLIECKRMGIPMKLPHINDSDTHFKIEGKGIRFGLSSIKFISDKIASRYIVARPFRSYQHVKEYTLTKGNGVNTRALQSMNIIGALTFPDNPRDENEIKENMYEYLNLPEFNVKIPQHYYAYISPTDDYDEKGAFVLMGIVRSIKRGTGWSRVDVLDNTGSVGVFDDEDTALEPGRTYIFLVSSNRIMEAIPVDEIQENKSTIIRFLNLKQITWTDEEYLVVSFKPRITKAGKRMASITLADADRNLLSVVCWSNTFAMAYTRMEEGSVCKVKLGKSKDDEWVLQEVL